MRIFRDGIGNEKKNLAQLERLCVAGDTSGPVRLEVPTAFGIVHWKLQVYRRMNDNSRNRPERTEQHLRELAELHQELAGNFREIDRLQGELERKYQAFGYAADAEQQERREGGGS